MDDLGYEGRGRRILELERELSEARRGILECQTRIVGLQRALALYEASDKLVENQPALMALTQDRDEAHSQLAESYAAIREVPRICLCAGGAGICGFCLWREKHAPVIARASEANIRRAQESKP